MSPAMLEITNPVLDIIQESFEDVSLSLESPSKQNSRSSRIKRNNSVLSNVSSLSVSSTNSRNSRSSVPTVLNNNSNTNNNINNSSNSLSNITRLNYSNSSTLNLEHSNNSRDLLMLTSSQRYRLNQRRKNNLKNNAANNGNNSNNINKIIQAAEQDPQKLINSTDFLSDDELPDDLIVYNVPFSRSLKSLNDHEFTFKKPLPKPKTVHYRTSLSTLGSPATRASSIFSIGSDLSELSFFEDPTESHLSQEMKLVSVNEDPKLNESLQRISILTNYKNLPSIPSSLSLSLPPSSTNSTPRISHNSNNKLTNTPSTIPIGKEKLSYLTPTRQTNLPPKNSYETLKHEREYEVLLQKQVDLEKEKLSKRQKQLERLDAQKESDLKSWKLILQSYDKLICLPRTRELWWRGIPSQIRYRVWSQQIGNRYQLTNEQMENWLDKSEEIINKACDYKILKDQISQRKFEKSCGKDIEFVKSIELYSKWIQGAFPNLLHFQIGVTFESILRIMTSFTFFQKETGYLKDISLEQLTNLICVLYNAMQDEKMVLVAFTTLISKKLPHQLLAMISNESPSNFTDSAYLEDIESQFSTFLSAIAPSLYHHFTETIKLSPMKYLSKSITNLFTSQLSMPILSRIIDIYIFEGDSFLLRVQLALLKKICYKLMGTETEVLDLIGFDCLKNLNLKTGVKSSNGFKYLDVGDAEEFIKDVRGVLKKNKT